MSDRFFRTKWKGGAPLLNIYTGSIKDDYRHKTAGIRGGEFHLSTARVFHTKPRSREKVRTFHGFRVSRRGMSGCFEFITRSPITDETWRDAKAGRGSHFPWFQGAPRGSERLLPPAGASRACRFPLRLPALSSPWTPAGGRRRICAHSICV